MKPYKRQFIEMAQVGRIGNLIVQVYSDHNLPHFHVIKKDHFEVKLNIITRSILGYVFQNDGEKILNKDLQRIEDWLKEPSKEDKTITNIKGIAYAWNIMNKTKVRFE